MARLRTKFKPKQKIGWWTLQSVIAEQPSAYRCGDRWSAKCRCGTIGSVTHEALQTGRSRACDACAPKFRALHDAAAQLAELGALVIGEQWATLYARSPQNAMIACERRLAAAHAQLETFARLARANK